MEFTAYEVMFAFGLTLFAGLSTGIGAAIVFFFKRIDNRMIAGSLGFSGGVMIYISFVEILPIGLEDLGYQGFPGFMAFILGFMITMLIDRLIPEERNPHEARKDSDIRMIKSGRKNKDMAKARIRRMSLITAGVIAFHNFPEGMATMAAGLKDISLGIPIAIAIAIHNIPEGISVSVPFYAATGDKKKGFYLSVLSGLAEPVGAAIGFVLLFPIMSDAVLTVVFTAVGGIMVYISLDEILPMAREHGHGHTVLVGLLLGFVVMGISLILL